MDLIAIWPVWFALAALVLMLVAGSPVDDAL
jgi:hypothetical protein